MTNLIRLCLLLFFFAPYAIVDASDLDKQENRAQQLFDQIHCVVCNGQALAGSQAPLARAMREKIREDIAAGLSDKEIKALLQRQYGDEILMSPPLRADTYALWFLPAGLFIIGGLVIVIRVLGQHKDNNEGGGG